MRRPTRICLALRGWIAAALSAGALACAAAEAPPTTHEIRDPHYGDTLFQFFQDRYFSAVTSLMVSQHFDRVSHHADEAEILRGGMLLSYGLEQQAGQIFARLLRDDADPKVRDRAWFFLAKIRYQRGYTADAEAALAHVSHELPPELQEDRALLQANLLMARGDPAAAATVLAAVAPEAGSARYAKYNLGIALIKAGAIAKGSAVLDELGLAPAEDEEFRALRDRANVALGFNALAAKDPAAARVYLERVRLKSLQADQALLGFGWAAFALKDPKLALVPWQELAQRDLGDSAALEARIAVPYAYAELGAFGQSRAGYDAAIDAFAKEGTSLDESIQAIRSGTLVEALYARNPGEEMGWFWRLGDLPGMPHAGHLSQVLAEHSFQEAFKNYRDLRYLGKNLQEWRDKLGVFRDMLATRRKAFAERLPQVRERAGTIGLGGLRQRRDALAAEIAQAEADADGRAFADARQLDLLARLARARTLAAGDDPALAAPRERLRLAAGALDWELAASFAPRVWAAKRALKDLDLRIEEARRRDAELATAQGDEPVRFDQFEQRIAAIAPLLDRLIPRVAGLTREQQQAVQDIAVAALDRQKERLADYTLQARFALAQLYDRAQPGGSSEPDAHSSATAKDPLALGPSKESEHASATR